MAPDNTPHAAPHSPAPDSLPSGLLEDRTSCLGTSLREKGDGRAWWPLQMLKPMRWHEAAGLAGSGGNSAASAAVFSSGLFPGGENQANKQRGLWSCVWAGTVTRSDTTLGTLVGTGSPPYVCCLCLRLRYVSDPQKPNQAAQHKPPQAWCQHAQRYLHRV